MIFEMFVPNRIIFGCGSINKIGDAAHNMGQNALIVCGGGSVHMECVIRLIRESGIDVDIFRVVKEPDISIIRKGLDAAKENKCDFVIGFGGGSVMDAAKAIAALMTNTGDILDYLEVVGKGREIENYPTSMIAVPTTAGTGTEVTKNAVIRSPQHHVKVSMRSTKMIPTVAIVDPELTYSMPPSITASTGMDAFTQVIEAYVSNRGKSDHRYHLFRGRQARGAVIIKSL